MLYVRKIDLKNRNDSNVLLYEMTEAGSRVLRLCMRRFVRAAG